MSERKSVFITGAASGIGLAAAKKFAAEGWFVGLADIDEKGLAEALRALGNGAGATYELDVRDKDLWRGTLEAFVKEAGGRLDLLVNNAGVCKYDWFDAQSTEDDDDFQVDINIKGVLLGARAALPYLRTTPGARLINIASQASMTASPRLAVYSATKFAVRGLSEALDIEWMRFGVRVMCIMPTVIDTPLLDKAVTSDGFSFRKATEQMEAIPASRVADTIFGSATGEHMHYGVGEAPERQAEPYRAAAAETRARWSAMLRPRPPKSA